MSAYQRQKGRIGGAAATANGQVRAAETEMEFADAEPAISLAQAESES